MHRDGCGLVPDHGADLVEHRRDRLGGGPDPLRQNKFAVVDAQQWLQRQRGAQPGRRPADPPAAAQVVQPVHHDVGVGTADGRTGLGGNGFQVGAGRGGPAAASATKPVPIAADFESTTVTAAPSCCAACSAAP